MKKVFAIVAGVLLLSAVCITVVAITTKEPVKKECTKEAQKCDKKDDATKSCAKEVQVCEPKKCEAKACDSKKDE